MKFWKALLIVLLLLICTLSLCGCAESFTYTYYIDGVGAVHVEYLLVYDKESSQAAEVRDQAAAVMKHYVENNGYNDYATISTDVEGEVRLSLYFSSVTDYYIALGYDGREENEPIEPTKIGVMNYYEIERTSYLTENKVAYVRSMTAEEYRDFPMDCNFYYTYGTTSKLTDSNGEKTEKDGVYYHTWKLTYGEESDMELYVYSPNVAIWFSIFISIFILSLVAIFVIINIKRKKDIKRAAEAALARSESGDDADRSE